LCSPSRWYDHLESPVPGKPAILGQILLQLLSLRRADLGMIPSANGVKVSGTLPQHGSVAHRHIRSTEIWADSGGVISPHYKGAHSPLPRREGRIQLITFYLVRKVVYFPRISAREFGYSAYFLSLSWEYGNAGIPTRQVGICPVLSPLLRSGFLRASCSTRDRWTVASDSTLN